MECAIRSEHTEVSNPPIPSPALGWKAVIFDQSGYALRCEWGAHGVAQLSPVSDVLIIVDVLSFSTAVDIALANGAIIFPYGNRDHRIEEYARARSAQVAEK